MIQPLQTHREGNAPTTLVEHKSSVMWSGGFSAGCCTSVESLSSTSLKWLETALKRPCLGTVAENLSSVMCVGLCYEVNGGVFFLTEDGAKKGLPCWEPKDVSVDQFPAKVILLCEGGRRVEGERIMNVEREGREKKERDGRGMRGKGGGGEGGEGERTNRRGREKGEGGTEIKGKEKHEVEEGRQEGRAKERMSKRKRQERRGE